MKNEGRKKERMSEIIILVQYSCQGFDQSFGATLKRSSSDTL